MYPAYRTYFYKPYFFKLQLLIALLLLSLSSLQAQRQAANWVFGEGLGLDFNCNPVRQFNTRINAKEGISTISNECGDLIFSGNGDSVYNAIGMTITGGGNQWGDRRATQSSLMIPHPGKPMTYLVFNVDANENFNVNGLSYSEVVHMMPAGGNMISSNNPLCPQTEEMLTAVNHAVLSTDTWIITKLKNLSVFKVFNVGLSGVDTAAVVSTVPTISNPSGQLKASPTGKILALRNPLTLYEFNDTNGKIRILFELQNSFLKDGNSVEFSPDGTKLYINNFNGSASENGVWMFNLTNLNKTAVENSATRIYTKEVKGGLQLAINGRIYVIRDPASNKLDMINGSSYSEDVLSFVKRVGMYLPNFNQSYFKNVSPFDRVDNTCQGDYTYFFPKNKNWDSCMWVFGDTASKAANYAYNEETPNHQYTGPGCYTVDYTIYKNGDTTKYRDYIKIGKKPTISFPSDTSICKDPRVLYINAQTVDEYDATYSWSDNTSNYFINITSPGMYTLKKTFKCCENTDSIRVTFDTLNVDFGTNDRVQCENSNLFEYYNISKLAKGGSVQWDLGNGQFTFGDTARASYPTSGFYYVGITIRSVGGCRSYGSKAMIVLKKPDGRFSVDTIYKCYTGHRFTIADSTKLQFGHGLLKTTLYDFGDSTSSTKKVNYKSYLKPGVYNLTLYASSDEGCVDTVVQPLKVFESPLTGFYADTVDKCYNGHEFTFRDTSWTQTDTVTFRKWVFDKEDSTFSFNGPDSIKHKFGTIGNKLVKLITGTTNGCTDTSYLSVRVHSNPIAAFTIADTGQCLSGNAFDFKSGSTNSGQPISQYYWNFGDGTFGSDSLVIGKNYMQPGVKTVKLVVTNAENCKDSINYPIEVFPMPKGKITVNDSGQCIYSNSFMYNGNLSSVSKGNITLYEWDFDNGNVQNGVAPGPVSYGIPDAYRIKLRLTTNYNCVDSVYQDVRVFPKPTAVISSNDTADCMDGNRFFFDGKKSNVNPGSIARYHWTIDGTFYDSANNQFYHSFAAPGAHQVDLKVTSNENCINDTSLTVMVYANPVADFFVRDACLKQRSIFTSTSSVSAGSIVKYIWLYDDGVVDSLGAASIRYYNQPGTYGAALRVVSDKGCEGSVYKPNIALVKELPIAGFDWYKVDDDLQNSFFQLVNKSQKSISYEWYMNDEYLNSDFEPLLTFGDTGTFFIKLVVENNLGCYDTMIKSLFAKPAYIFHMPNAFSPNGDDLNNTFAPVITKYVLSYNFQIFNRWGEILFSSRENQKGWDGTFKGVACPDGVYFYQLSLMDIFNTKRNYKGFVYLIR